MRNRTLPLLCLLLLFVPTVALGQNTPTARFTAYLQTMSRSTSLKQVRPYFSKAGWNKAYGDLGPMSTQDEAEILKTTSEDFKGWAVKSEKIKDGKATLVVGPPKGESTDVFMIQEGGSWVIDG